MMKFKILLAALLCMNAFSAIAASKKSGESMELAASAWGAFMRGNVVVNGQKAEIHRDTWDYYQDLAVGGSLELALRNKDMVLLGTVDYFDNISSKVTVGSQEGTLETGEIIGCIAIGYPLSGTGQTSLDFLVGLQGQRMENELRLDNGTVQKSSVDVYDPVVMVRIKLMLGNRLYIHIPLALGVSYLGDSELVYNAGCQLSYQLTDSFDLRAGYRISGYDYRDNANNSWDYYQQGFTLGLGLTF